jgi:hypothetical protein
MFFLLMTRAERIKHTRTNISWRQQKSTGFFLRLSRCLEGAPKKTVQIVLYSSQPKKKKKKKKKK